MEFDYQAFLSYSHAADARLAPALQRGLQRVAKPWYRRSRVKVFLDATSLSANAALWPEIERQLARCAWFVLMASPAAAASPWVGREIAWWLQHRGPDRLLIVLSDGELAWDARRGDFDWTRSTALPTGLRGAYASEPLYVDLRWARSAALLSMRDARFRDAVLTLAAPLHGRPKDELDSEEIRQQRRFLVAGAALGAGALASALVAGVSLWNAREEQARAEASWRESESRRLATRATQALAQDEAVDDALRVALMAWTLAPTDEAVAALDRLAGATAAMAGILGQHTAGLSALAFSDDSRQLVTLGRDGSLQRWRTGDWQRASAPLPGSLRNGAGVRFDAAGTHVVTWDDVGALEVWDLAEGRHETIPSGVAGDMFGRTAALSADAARVAVSGRPGALGVWDRRAPGWRLAPAALGTQRVVALHFDTDTRLRVALIDRALRIAVWDLARGTWTQGPPSESRAMLAYATQGAFAAGGRRVVVTGDGAGSVYDVDAALRPRLLADLRSLKTDKCNSAHLDDTGRRVMVRLRDRWQLTDLTRPDAPMAEGGAPAFTCSDWSPDLRWRADRSSSRWQAGDNRGERLLVWDQSAAASAVAATTFETACGFRDDPTRCAARLCDALAPTLDEAQLRTLFGIQDHVVRYDRYREVLGRPLCGRN